MQLSKDLREFVELFNSNKVEFVVVGAFAVAWHGYARFTADLDILIRPGPPNSQRVLQALAEFGFRSLPISLADLSIAGQVIQLGVQPNRIDLLTGITGVTFEEVWESRISGTLDGVPVNFISRRELIRNKEATNRSKDRADVDELRKRLPRADESSL